MENISLLLSGECSRGLSCISFNSDENWDVTDIQQINHIPSTNARTNISARTSEDPCSNSLGNIEESQKVNEISTNYNDS